MLWVRRQFHKEGQNVGSGAAKALDGEDGRRPLGGQWGLGGDSTLIAGH